MFEQLANKDYYTKLFRSWSTQEIEIDKTKHIYKLYNPESSVEFVTMFVDNERAFFYGDFGTLIFDFTWNATPDNIPYNSMDYIIEKLSHQSTQYNTKWDTKTCENDIIKILRETTLVELNENIQNIIVDTFLSTPVNPDDFNDMWKHTLFDIKNRVKENEYDDICEILQEQSTFYECAYAYEAIFNASDIFTFNAFLLNNSENYEKYENCGKYLAQRVYINLYAMYIYSQIKPIKTSNRQDVTE